MVIESVRPAARRLLLLCPLLLACAGEFSPDLGTDTDGTATGDDTDGTATSGDATESESETTGSTGCRYGAASIVFAREDTDILSYSLWRFDFADDSITRLTDDPGNELASDLSPDASTLVFVSDRGGVTDLWTVPVDGGELAKVAPTAVVEIDVQWLADGSGFLASVVDADGYDVVHISADGSAIEPLVVGPESDLAARLSHDGQTIVFIREEAEFFFQLYTAASDGSGAQQLVSTPGWATSPDWSPRDQTIAFIQQLGPRGVFLVNSDGTNVQQIATDEVAMTPRFSPDGQYLAFATQRYSIDPLNDPGDPYDEILVLDLEGNEVERITDLAGRDRSPLWIPCD